MRQQDIEIYIVGSAHSDIEQWLASIFGPLDLEQQAGNNSVNNYSGSAAVAGKCSKGLHITLV